MDKLGNLYPVLELCRVGTRGHLTMREWLVEHRGNCWHIHNFLFPRIWNPSMIAVQCLVKFLNAMNWIEGFVSYRFTHPDSFRRLFFSSTFVSGCCWCSWYCFLCFGRRHPNNLNIHTGIAENSVCVHILWNSPCAYCIRCFLNKIYGACASLPFHHFRLAYCSFKIRYQIFILK